MGLPKEQPTGKPCEQAGDDVDEKLIRELYLELYPPMSDEEIDRELGKPALTIEENEHGLSEEELEILEYDDGRILGAWHALGLGDGEA